MSQVHLALDGRWARCRAGDACRLDYHLQMSLKEARQLPGSFLDQLIEDPRERITRPNGDVGFFDQGKLHSIYDRPAFIKFDGTLEWHKHGRKHRLGDKPAVIRADGVSEWWVDGKLHRSGDNPALVSSDGNHRVWSVRGATWRSDPKMPAAIYADGSMYFYQSPRYLSRVSRPQDPDYDASLLHL